MSAKHSTVIPLRRYTFIAGAATLLVVLVAWVAVRAVGPTQQDNRLPLMMQPTIPVGAAAPSVIPWGPRSTAASPSVSPAPSQSLPPARTPVRTPASSSPAAPKPTEKATTKPPAKPPSKPPSKPAPTPAAAFTAQYSLPASWDRGFVAAILVTNTGTRAGTWTVTVSYSPRDGVRVGNVWNAQLSRQGDTFVLTGGPLAPGATVNLGYEASKQVRSRIQPTGCAVDGTPCRFG